VALTVSDTPTVRPHDTTTPSPFPSSTPTQTSTSGPTWATIEDDATCRAGPGTGYNVLGYLTAGQAALAFGVDPLGDWWWIQYPSGSLFCWISGLLVSFESGSPGLPVLTAEPTYTPTVHLTQPPQPPPGPGATATPTLTKTPKPPTPNPSNTPCGPEEPAYVPSKLSLVIPPTPCP
jgi:hypothetical protein